jgi:hypothetical protein
MLVNTFSSREIALSIWIVVFFAEALFNRKVRESIAGLIKVSLTLKIITPVALLITYVIGVVWALREIKLWTPSLLKDTVLWFLFSGLALAFSFVSKPLGEGVLKKIIVDNIKVIVLLEFIIDSYPFSLATELVLIPFIAFIAMLDAVSKTDEKYAVVGKFATAVQVLFGLVVISFAVVHAVNDYQSLESVDTIRQVLLVPILSVSLVPYIYLLLVFTNYESLFLVLKMNREKEPGVEQYAKWRLVNHLRMRPEKIRTFHRAHGVDLIAIRTRGDIDRLINGRG